MRQLYGVLLVVGVLFITGCLKNKVVVQVRPDGSGNIVAMKAVNKSFSEIVEKRFSRHHNDDTAGEERNVFCDEKRLTDEAINYGEGVEFSKAQSIDGPEGRGHIVVYTFKDINQVIIPLSNIFK